MGQPLDGGKCFPHYERDDQERRDVEFPVLARHQLALEFNSKGNPPGK
jgi:hypothetical protein